MDNSNQSHPQLIIRHRTKKSVETVGLKVDQLKMGRLRSNDIVLSSPSVSRQHAQVLKVNDSLFLIDLESGNGTFLNGERIPPKVQKVLKNGDLVRIEEFDIEVQIPESKETNSEKTSHKLDTKQLIEEATDPGILEVKMIQKVLSAMQPDQCPGLEIVAGPGKGQKVLLKDDKGQVTLGRGKKCNFILPSDAVSRQHALVKKTWTAVTLTDLNSSNGTFLNKKRVEKANLSDGDLISLGDITLKFFNPQEVDLEELAGDIEENTSPQIQIQEDSDSNQDQITSADKSVEVKEPAVQDQQPKKEGTQSQDQPKKDLEPQQSKENTKDQAQQENRKAAKKEDQGEDAAISPESKDSKTKEEKQAKPSAQKENPSDVKKAVIEDKEPNQKADTEDQDLPKDKEKKEESKPKQKKPKVKKEAKPKKPLADSGLVQALEVYTGFLDKILASLQSLFARLSKAEMIIVLAGFFVVLLALILLGVILF